MRKTVWVWPILLVVLSSPACTVTVPVISLPGVPTLEVGPMQGNGTRIDPDGTGFHGF